MKFYKNFLFAFFFVGVMGWASSPTASPIPYTFTQYHAYAESGSIIDEQITSSPPVEVFALDWETGAGASSPDMSYIDAWTSADKGSGNSFLQATFKFTNNFPALRLQYDYNLLSDVHWLSGSGASITSSLMDITTSIKIWSDDLNASAAFDIDDPYFEGKDEKSGSIDEVLYLTLGHDYELFLSCESSGAGAHHCYASAEMKNIQVTGVPLPSAFVLLSSGLIGLWGFRKRLIT